LLVTHSTGDVSIKSEVSTAIGSGLVCLNRTDRQVDGGIAPLCKQKEQIMCVTA